MAKERLSLFGSIPAEFPSDYSLEESVAVLQAKVTRPGHPFLFSDQAVGQVTPERVHITRVGYNAGLMGPAFKGHFHQAGDGVVLRGAFSVPLAVKLCLLFQTCLFGLATIGCTAAALAGVEVIGYISLIPGTMTALGIVVMRIGPRKSRAAMPWLAAVIARTLSKDESAKKLPLPAAVLIDPALASRIVLALTALLSLASAATGVCALYMDRNDPPQEVFVRYDSWGRLVAAAVAATCTFLFVGTFRRTDFGWKCSLVGFAAFGLAMIVGFGVAYAKVPHPDRTEAIYWSSMAFMALVLGLPAAIPTLLLYKQKKEFLEWRRSNQ